METSTFVYDDPDHPYRATGTIQSPAYVGEDRALLRALKLYEDGLCGGCRFPVDVAWHSDMDGWFEVEEYVCYACSARSPDGPNVTRSMVRDVRPESKPLPPFVLGVTTTSGS